MASRDSAELSGTATLNIEERVLCEVKADSPVPGNFKSYKVFLGAFSKTFRLKILVCII